MTAQTPYLSQKESDLWLWEHISRQTSEELNKEITLKNIDTVIRNLTIALLCDNPILPTKSTAEKLCKVINDIQLPNHLRDRFYGALEFTQVFTHQEATKVGLLQKLRYTTLSEILNDANYEQYSQTLGHLSQKCYNLHFLKKFHHYKLMAILCVQVRTFGQSIYPAIRFLISQYVLNDFRCFERNPLIDFINEKGDIGELFSKIPEYIWNNPTILVYLSADWAVFQDDYSPNAFLALYNPCVREQYLNALSPTTLEDYKLIALAQIINYELNVKKLDEHKYVVRLLDKLSHLHTILFLENLTSPRGLEFKKHYEKTSYRIKELKKTVTSQMLYVMPYIDSMDTHTQHDIQKFSKAQTILPDKEQVLPILRAIIPNIEILCACSEDPQMLNTKTKIKSILIKILSRNLNADTDKEFFKNTSQALEQSTPITLKYAAVRKAVEALIQDLLDCPLDELPIDWDDLVNLCFQSYDRKKKEETLEEWANSIFKKNNVKSVSQLVANVHKLNGDISTDDTKEVNVIEKPLFEYDVDFPPLASTFRILNLTT